jgi:hypothetical protein
MNKQTENTITTNIVHKYYLEEMPAKGRLNPQLNTQHIWMTVHKYTLIFKYTAHTVLSMSELEQHFSSTIVPTSTVPENVPLWQQMFCCGTGYSTVPHNVFCE